MAGGSPRARNSPAFEGRRTGIAPRGDPGKTGGSTAFSSRYVDLTAGKPKYRTRGSTAVYGGVLAEVGAMGSSSMGMNGSARVRKKSR